MIQGIKTNLLGFLSGFFPETEQRQWTRRDSWCLAGVFVLGVVVSLLRTGGPGALDTIWIEDAGILLTQALSDPWKEFVFRSMNGYWYIGPRIYTKLASMLPIAWAPGAMAIMAASMMTLFSIIAFFSSRAFIASTWCRVAVAAPIILVPLGQTQLNNDLSGLHFPALMAMFWILLWRPSTKTGAIVATCLAGFISYSGILFVIFLPLLIARLFIVRSKTTVAVAIAYFSGFHFQLAGILLGVNNQTSVRKPRWDMFWVIGEYFNTAIPRAIFGEKIINPLRPIEAHMNYVIVAWVITAIAIVVALRRITAPAWKLFIVAISHSFLLFALEISQMGWVEPRYPVVPAMLLYTALFAILQPKPVSIVVRGTGRTIPTFSGRQALGRLPTWGFALLFMVVIGMNYRTVNARSTSPSWRKVVRDAEIACKQPRTNVYRYVYSWWILNIPCSRLN